MCMSCGCNNNAVKVPATEKLDGKPNLDPKGGYAGVGGTVKWPTK